MTLNRVKLAKILGLLSSDKNGEIMSAAQAAVALIRNANTSWPEVLEQNAVADDARAVHTDDEARTLLAEYEYKVLALGAENEKLRETVMQLSVENNTLREQAAEARMLLAEYEYKVLALGAENEKLRETVMQLSVENNTLREQAARRLAHRILDGVKQSGQALRALSVAFDGSAPRTQRVVVHGLVAAGMALALGIVAFLALHDSGTMASSEQETQNAAARSGELPAGAERRGSISDQLSSATMVTPEAIPQPPVTDAALAPVENLTTLPATLPPAIAAPDQTAQTPEAPPPVISSVPAEEQAAPPATSLPTSPLPTQSPRNQRLTAAEMAALVSRGDAFLNAGDIVSARLFYERASDGGDGGAALRLGKTFDPAFLRRTGARGTLDDPAQASSWYRRAADLGDLTAQEYLQNLEKQRVPEPGSPPH